MTHIQTLGGLSQAALNNAFARVSKVPVDSAWGTLPRRQVTLIAGDGETAAGSGATVVADTSIFETGAQGWRVTSTGSITESRLRVTATDAPLVFSNASAVCARLYIPDASKFNSITLDIYGDAALTFSTRWSRVSTGTQPQPLVNGWNTLRFPAHVSPNRTPGIWGNVYRVDVIGTLPSAVAGSVFTVDRVWVETPTKATVHFINDHGTQDFLDNGYHDMKALGIPVTFAIDPSLVGQVVLESGFNVQRLTLAQLQTLAAENDNRVGVHAFGDLLTSGMTNAQIRADVIRCAKWFEGNGFGAPLWRAAWYQETAPNYLAAKPFYVAQATYRADSGPVCWPPTDLDNIPRYHLYQTRTTADLDSLFSDLQSTHEHVFLFAHRVAPLAQCGPFDIDTTTWAYLVNKLQAGVSAGWLEGVSFEQLFSRMGGRFRQSASGHTTAEYLDRNGDLTEITLI